MTHPTPQQPVDKDLAEQANPGYGVPSQDPRPGAQQPLSSDEAERETKSVYVGGGVMAGAVAGSVAGTVVGGPVGAVVGAAAGGVAGAIGAEAVGAKAKPGD